MQVPDLPSNGALCGCYATNVFLSASSVNFPSRSPASSPSPLSVNEASAQPTVKVPRIPQDPSVCTDYKVLLGLILPRKYCSVPSSISTPDVLSWPPAASFPSFLLSILSTIPTSRCDRGTRSLGPIHSSPPPMQSLCVMQVGLHHQVSDSRSAPSCPLADTFTSSQ